ncbi:hypothetical protein [Desulfotalea psychrophila]|uniref:Uncharacterized protein n=1 Tax=Desulfotalea psychrophila (strain LSv54 / DSM 12343) TaxID=177439 RepID=Q6AI66_DESPS|nr:hypothetical protein [Desulfotalea psychrophila]CAG37863.1 unknown protein [Desulfotalea psychrophila LSv54]
MTTKKSTFDKLANKSKTIANSNPVDIQKSELIESVVKREKKNKQVQFYLTETEYNKLINTMKPMEKLSDKVRQIVIKSLT